MIRVAVIGTGYWGPNLIRNFSACPETRLVAACDKDPARLARALLGYPEVRAVANPDRLLAREDIDAVAIATPVGTHASLAVAALRRKTCARGEADCRLCSRCRGHGRRGPRGRTCPDG